METTYRTLIPLFAELTGERVLVRPFRAEDADELHAAIEESRDQLRPWMPIADILHTQDETRDWILRGVAERILREDIACGIWDWQGRRFLGGLGLHPRNWQTGYFEVSYWLRSSAEGHGYVAEAVRLVTDYSFDHLDARRVEIRCNALNTRSANVARRLGFVQEALLRNFVGPRASIMDTLVFARIPADPRG